MSVQSTPRRAWQWRCVPAPTGILKIANRWVLPGAGGWRRCGWHRPFSSGSLWGGPLWRVGGRCYLYKVEAFPRGQRRLRIQNSPHTSVRW